MDPPTSDAPARPVWAGPEAIIVGGAGLIQVGGTVLASHHQVPVRALDAGGVALLAAGVAVLPLRRRHPVAVLAAAFVATAAYWSIGYPRGPVFASLIVALVAVVIAGRHRAAIAAVTAGFLVFPWLPYWFDNGPRPTLASIVGLGAWLVALLSIIELVNTRRARAREAAKVRAQEIRRRAADERLRIAHEIHDAVAHNMSLINIQAGVGLHLIDQQPDQARDALAVIKEASKGALIELRSILGVLREADETPRTPTPSLSRIEELVTQAELAGIHVRLDIDGDLHHLPRHIDLAAYRIAQESLTNVARHTDRAGAMLRIRADDDTLTLEVLDEGTGHQARHDLPTGGNGITGMLERAASVGGRLTAGPRPGTGFAVRAELPLGQDQ